MKRNIVFCFIYVIVFVFSISCRTKGNKNKYFYLSQYEALDVGYPYGAIVYKSSEEYLYSDVIIGGNVLAFKQNLKYIVTKQNFDVALLRKWIGESIESFIETNGYNGVRKELRFYDYVFPDTILLKYNITDSSIKYLTNIALESPLIQKAAQNDTNYWIIEISNDNIIGPLIKSEFEATRKQLQIPDKLKFD